MHDEHDTMKALSIAAALPADSGTHTLIDQARAAGVSAGSIIQALLAHAGDVQAIIAAIKALIAKIHPKPPAA